MENDAKQAEQAKQPEQVQQDKPKVQKKNIGMYVVITLLLLITLSLLGYILWDRYGSDGDDEPDQTENTSGENENGSTESDTDEDETVLFSESLDSEDGTDVLFFSKLLSETSFQAFLYQPASNTVSFKNDFSLDAPIRSTFDQFKMAFDINTGNVYLSTYEDLSGEPPQMGPPPCSDGLSGDDCRLTIYSANLSDGTTDIVYSQDDLYEWELLPDGESIVIFDWNDDDVSILKVMLPSTDVENVLDLVDFWAGVPEKRRLTGSDLVISNDGSTAFMVGGRGPIADQQVFIRSVDLETGGFDDIDIDTFTTNAIGRPSWSYSKNYLSFLHWEDPDGPNDSFDVYVYDRMADNMFEVDASFSNFYSVWAGDSDLIWEEEDGVLARFFMESGTVSELNTDNPGGFDYLPLSASVSGQYLLLSQNCLPENPSCNDDTRNMNVVYELGSETFLEPQQDFNYANRSNDTKRIAGHSWFSL